MVSGVKGKMKIELRKGEYQQWVSCVAEVTEATPVRKGLASKALTQIGRLGDAYKRVQSRAARHTRSGPTIV